MSETRIGTAEDVEIRTEGLIPARRAYELARDGVLPAGVVIRIGRQVRFNLAALDRWLADGGAALPGGWRRQAAHTPDDQRH
jgi:hypothetical protein